MSAATLRDEDIAEALAIRRLGIVEELEAIEVFEIEGERTFGTVDLDLDMIFAPERKAGSFQIGESAVLEAADEHGSVIDGDFAHFLRAFAAEPLALAGFVHDRPFFDEGVHQAADLFEFADEVASQIDDMGVDIAVSAAAAHAFLKAPDEREFRIDDPVLSVTGAVMENFAEGAFIDHFLG